ncbi:YrhB domain-containing protein [Roseateles sp. SL47]|uniref:YrhB domain-containing protein n=1 Tax=Roseateles sp. SL47 TaxID=2995138 RepID=UPI002271FDFA|nr:YrhB domain-containing protein [Roseateles sp. SL47]WAC73739.1 YrhB domain-containing protein [Roseateles sp. SL47]
MSITQQTADATLSAHLRGMEQAMDQLGAALPENRDRPPHQLVVLKVEEHDFGWVYFYNSKEFAETGDFLCSLAGNSPLIVDRHEGKLYGTGSAMPIEHYLSEYRAGVRRPL